MAGPGGVEAGRANLKVLPDLSQFLRSLERFIQRIERQVVVELPTTLDLRGVQESLAEVKARLAANPVTLPAELNTDAGEMRREHAVLQAQADAHPVEVPVKVDRSQLRDIGLFLGRIKAPDLSGLTTSLGAFTKGAGIAGLGITAAAAVPQVLALAGSVSQLAGVGALLPGALAGGGLAVATLVVGFQGLGDALKSAKTPAEAKKVAQALASLAPAARSTVQAIKRLGPGFKTLRLDVQQELFAGLGKTVADLGRKYLPVLQGGMSKVGRGLNGMARAFAGFLGQSGTVSALNTLFRDVQGSLRNLAPAVSPFLGALRDIGTVGGSFLPGLAKNFATLADKFAAFISSAAKSGALQDFISAGLSGLRDLAKIAGSAGSAILGIVKAAQNAGGGTLATLAGVLGKVADAVNSPAFQKGLTAFFAGVSAGAGALMSSALPAIADMLANLGPVIADFARNAGPAIGQAIAALAPVAGELLKALGPAFVALLQAAADVIKAIAPTLTDWARALQSVNPLLLGLAGVALALVPTLVSVAGSVASALSAFAGLAALFAEGGLLAGLGAIILPIAAVVAGIAALAAVFVLAYQNSQAIRDGVAAIGTAFAGMWTAVQPILTQLQTTVMQYWPQIQVVAQQVWSTVLIVIQTVLLAIQRIVQAVTLVITVLWNVFGDTILSVINAVFPAILGIISGVLDIIKGVFGVVLNLLQGNWSGAWNSMKLALSGVWKVITSIVSGALGVVKALVSGELGIIGRLFSAGWGALSGVVSRAWGAVSRAVSGGIGDAVGLIGGLRGRITGALGDLGGLLFHSGAALIQGLVDGIRSRIDAVKHAASSAAQAIKDFFPGSPVKDGPLTSWNNGGAGKRLADMLADGLGASHGRVADAAAALARQVAIPAVGATPALAGAGAGSGISVYTSDPLEAAHAVERRQTFARNSRR